MPEKYHLCSFSPSSGVADCDVVADLRWFGVAVVPVCEWCWKKWRWCGFGTDAGRFASVYLSAALIFGCRFLMYLLSALDGHVYRLDVPLNDVSQKIQEDEEKQILMFWCRSRCLIMHHHQHHLPATFFESSLVYIVYLSYNMKTITFFWISKCYKFKYFFVFLVIFSS